MRYSFLITTRNDAPTIGRALDSLTSQLPADSEVLVVDALSDDGSQKILADYPGIRVIEVMCTKGRGRQIALDNARGDYVIMGVDTDDVVAPVVKDFVEEYHAHHEGKIMRDINKGNMGPRALFVQLGGWRDMYCGEDLEFFMRAARAGVLDRTSITLVPDWKNRRRKGVALAIHDVRLFWTYSSLGLVPKTSWKTKPLYLTENALYRATHRGTPRTSWDTLLPERHS